MISETPTSPNRRESRGALKADGLIGFGDDGAVPASGCSAHGWFLHNNYVWASLRWSTFMEEKAAQAATRLSNQMICGLIFEHGLIQPYSASVF